MPKSITIDEVELIAEMIRNWPAKEALTWESICKGSKSILGFEPTRQALHKKPMVFNAYTSRKNQLRSQVNHLQGVARPRSMLAAMTRIAELQEQNEQLKDEVRKMAEVANRFIYNASIAGLTREQVMAPLPEKK